MQSIVVLCILLSGGFLTQAQLNYEGNPLTENTEYTAQESQFSDRNARQNYQRFEIADGRTITTSRGQFAASPIDPLATHETKHSSPNEDYTKNELPSKPSTRESIPVDNGLHLITENQSTRADITSKVKSEHREGNTFDSSLQDFPKAPITQTVSKVESETRQLREYPIKSSQALIDQLAISQEPSQAYHQSPRTYEASEQSSEMRNFALNSQPSSPINQASGQALSQFLNSRTPEESNMALQNYLQTRENSARATAQQSASLEQNINQQESVTFDGGIKENLGLRSPQQEIIPAQRAPAVSLDGPTGQFGYVSMQQYQQQPQQQHQQITSPRWNQIGFQSRRDAFQAGPGMRRPSRFRGPMVGRIRGNPWAQSRIGPGSFHQHKGPIYGGPPGPPSGLSGPWKSPVEVIYTKPPSFPSHVSSLPNNPPVPAYEDATKWFPDADAPPPQKDVYYSQLYAQSYDPHYYNYIAKTGKIKPWLYGKLGKHEDKSIWWELFSGFKNHGMKNMMNPMFLLGMTIPTLTFMLTALVQKRSLGREFAQLSPDIHAPEEYIEKYEKQIREALLAYDKQLKESIKDNKEGDRSW